MLHPSSYLSNLLAAAETIQQIGRLFAPAGEAKVTLIDPVDVAAVGRGGADRGRARGGHLHPHRS